MLSGCVERPRASATAAATTTLCSGGLRPLASAGTVAAQKAAQATAAAALFAQHQPGVGPGQARDRGQGQVANFVCFIPITKHSIFF